MDPKNMHVLSGSELRDVGFTLGTPGSILVYVTCVFDAATHHDTAMAALASTSVRHEEVRNNRRAEVSLRIGPAEGRGADQDALFADLLSDFTAAEAAWERAGVTPEFVKMVVVQYLAPTSQAHGLGLSRDWIRALARWGAELDIDQYVVIDE